MPAAATVFSWELLIANIPVEHFGRISITQSVDGYGTSGVVTATMTVTTNNKTYGGTSISGNDLPINAEVKLICSDPNIQPPTFYVTNRQVDGGITKWTCCDIMSKAEKTLTFEDSDFTDDKITIYNALERIKAQCGFEKINADGLALVANKELDRSDCEGNTARHILEVIACTLCGYWMADGSSISFVCFGKSVFGTTPPAYSAVNLGGQKIFSRVICTDDDDIYISGEGDNSQTLICTSEYASQETADFILSVMLGGGTYYTYQAWSCERGKASEWLYPGDYLFGNDILTCSSVTLYPSASGLYFAASRNNISEDETDYMSEVRRQLSRKVELNKINTNTAITKKGLYFFENGYKKKSAKEQKDAKYGFEVDKGVTTYDGAMVSKITPKSAYWNEDKTEATVSYEGKKFKYHIKRDDNGNVTEFSKEEITEEGT